MPLTRIIKNNTRSIAAFSSGVIWIDPGGGLGGSTAPPVPYYKITFWNASGYWEIN